MESVAHASGTEEIQYEDIEMSPNFKDPKMESCAAYGVVNTRQP